MQTSERAELVPILKIDRIINLEGTKYTGIVCSASSTPPVVGDYMVVPFKRNINVKIVEPDSHKKDSYILHVKGIGKKQLLMGRLLVPEEWASFYSKKACFVQKGRSDEFLSGPAVLKSSHPSLVNQDLNVKSIKKTGRIMVVECVERGLFVPGLDYEITKGNRTTSVYCVYGDTSDQKNIKLLDRSYKNYPYITPVYIFKSILYMLGWTYFPNFKDYVCDKNEVRLGAWMLLRRELIKLQTKLYKRCCNPGGCSIVDLETYMGLPERLLAQLIDSLGENQKVRKTEGYIIAIRENPEQNMSPAAKEIFKEISEAGSMGFSMGALVGDWQRKLVEELIRDDVIVRPDPAEDWVLAKKEAKNLVEIITGGLKTGEIISIAYIREKTDLSRKPIMCLLCYLKEKGFAFFEDGVSTYTGRVKGDDEKN